MTLHRVFFWLMIAMLLCLWHRTSAAPDPSFVHKPDTQFVAQWLKKSLAQGGTLPFSFDYGGKPSAGFLSGWTRQHTATKLDAQRTREEYVYTDPKTGLVVRCEAVRYSDYPAVEWTVYFINRGASDTPIISSIQALDTHLTHARPGDYLLHYSEGSHAAESDYQPQETTLPPGKDLSLGGASGWSTTEVLSYFNLMGPDTNLLIGIGWPGNWKIRFTRDTSSGLHILAGQGLTHFVLHPGEEARSPLIALQFYTGDWIRGQNLWRRWMLAHNLPRVKGKLPTPIIVAGPDLGTLHYSEAREKQQMELYAKRSLPITHWWIDAGWYLCNGNWWNVGTWTEDKAQFPDGIRSVTDDARAHGWQQVLWFEPERVTPGTEIDVNHPDWLIKVPGNDNYLFNLGIPAAREFMTNLISERITEYGADLFRSDFNFDPLGYWQSQDVPDRQGLAENHYVMGFLAFWDALRARHPNMFLDCCAGGGRRNDLEVLRRAIPLHETDYGGNPLGINYGASFWIPFHETGGEGVDYQHDPTYLYRVKMGFCHSIQLDASDDHLDWPLIYKLASQEQEILPYYYGDYYPLTPWSLDTAAWIAWQYDRPDLRSGMIQAFRRPDNGTPTQTFHLAGLDAKATYRVHDFDTNLDTMHTGVELMRTGLTITLPNKPQSALLLYRKIGNT